MSKTQLSGTSEAHDGAVVPPRLTPEDLASLMQSFTAVTAKLEATHHSLRAEVARLSSELQAANAALERSRRLAALGEMAAGIAHEVRNPLGSIGLYARLLDQDLKDLPKSQEIARKIESAAKSLDTVVGDVLTFAKEIRLRRDTQSLRGLLERSLEACQHDDVPGWQDVAIKWSVPAGIEIQADANLLVQAFTNLIRNAFESMAQVKGTSHTLKLVAAKRKATTADGRVQPAVVIELVDTGTGITSQAMKRMFNPFFTTRAAGTGLGLSIVHRIVEAHGGRISLSNVTTGRGAKVEMVLPEIAVNDIDGPMERAEGGFPSELVEKH